MSASGNAVLASIEKRNAERQNKIQEQKQQKKGEKTLTSESALEFTTQLKQDVTAFQTRLDALQQPSTPEEIEQVKAALDALSKTHATLSESLVRACLYLPQYDVRQSQIALKDLTERLTNARRTLVPKPKFSFKSRRSGKKKTAAQPKKTVTAEQGREESTSDAALSKLLEEKGAENRYTLHDKQNETFSLGAEIRGKDMMFSRLTKCRVRVHTVTSALRINDVEDCVFEIGPVAGSVHIERASKCVFVLATRQLRVHFCTDSDLYLLALSKPIIEDTTRVKFAPYNLSYDKLDEDLKQGELADRPNLWDQVQDFHWLRAQHSPNWSVLPVSERVCG